MRKLLALAMCAVMVFALCSCGSGNSNETVVSEPYEPSTPDVTPTPVPTSRSDKVEKMNGTWRDEVYREGSQSIQFEVIIDTDAGTVSINSITENARTVMSDSMPITEYGEDYISAGGYVFKYLDGDVLDVNSALFTNPPLTRYSDGTGNDAFGVDPNDYKSPTRPVTLSEDEKAALWALAEKAVKNELKSPSTAQFPASYGSDGVSFGKTGDTYYVESYVDAQNELGAVVRVDFMVTAHLDGITMVLDDCMIFE